MDDGLRYATPIYPSWVDEYYVASLHSWGQLVAVSQTMLSYLETLSKVERYEWTQGPRHAVIWVDSRPGDGRKVYFSPEAHELAQRSGASLPNMTSILAFERPPDAALFWGDLAAVDESAPNTPVLSLIEYLRRPVRTSGRQANPPQQ